MEWSTTEQKRTSTFCVCRKLFLQQLKRTFSTQCPNDFIIAPFKMFSEFIIELIKASKVLPVIEISSIVSISSLDFSIMPQHSWRDKLVNYFISVGACKPSFACLNLLLHKIFGSAHTNIMLQTISDPNCLWPLCISSY